MKDHYEFGTAEQGRFYVKPEDMKIPHYLSPVTEKALRERAAKTGMDVEKLLEAMIERELALPL